MSLLDSSYCGSIWHHGIKGQKWGVRRTPEQLGHRKTKSDGVENFAKSATMVDGVYYSKKGFAVAVAKLARYCLNPERKHAKDFFDLGYTENDADLLFSHIEDGFDLAKKTRSRTSEQGEEQFAIPMLLGVVRKEMLTTSWQVDKSSGKPRLTSAYRDRRNQKKG